MKYLKTYKLYESRRETLSGHLSDIIEKYASWWDLTSDFLLYRGVNHKDRLIQNQNFYLIDPSKHVRKKSYDSMGLHNIIIDNSKYWEGYPKRSKSLIATTDRYKAEKFGELYLVIPLKENTVFAVTPETDLFDSFPELRAIDDDLDTLEDLQTHIENTFDIIGKDIKTYDDLDRYLNVNNLLIEQDNMFSRTSGFGGLTIPEFNKIVDKYGSFLNYLESYMKPNENGFELLKYNKLNSNYSHEVWTEGKCLMIKYEYLEKFI